MFCKNLFTIFRMRISETPPQKGFTLIELLIVIAIIGILASIVLVSLSDARKAARDAARMTQLRSIATILDAYYIDHGYYPGGYGDPSCNGCADGYIGASPDPQLVAALSPYLNGSSLPADPLDTQPHQFYYDAKHACGGRPSRAHLYVVSLEHKAGNVNDLCTSWGGQGMAGAIDGTDYTWTIELER